MKNLKFIGPKDTFEKLREPKDITKTLKTPPVAPPKQIADEQKAKIAQMEVADKAKRERAILVLKKQLEGEVAKWRQVREEQLRQHRQPQEQPAVLGEPKPLREPITRRKRGLFGFWSKRIKSAQQQARPETVGRRIGG